MPKPVDLLSLDAGELRNPITIQASSDVSDGCGGVSSSWNVVLATWAKIATASQREVFQAGSSPQFAAQVTHKVTIRWPGASIALAGGMQVLFGSRVFAVQTVENVQERNRVVNLMCVEINGAV